jgi:NADPH-dependent 2,4-dienoyl-CoA reductase/sulfur reductase-like enzyme/rhodanese-related sulfurtransferase
MKVVIVGGVAGGASAAARARRLSESAEIILLERGQYVSFANCGLPYYVGEEIKQREKLIVTSPTRLKERFRIDVRVGNNVTEIHRSNKTITVTDAGTGKTYEESYDKLILSPGASPFKPPIPGIDLPNVLTLRTLGDVDRIKHLVDSGIREAMVIGGGFIGLEMVENLVKRGVRTTLVQLADQIMVTMDREMTTPIVANLKKYGVELLLKEQAESVEKTDNDRLRVKLAGGSVLESDMVLFGVGVRPENRLAIQAELSVGKRGGIITNQHMQTNDPDIYAVGDAVEVEEFVLKSRAQIALAGPANRQGRLAADHIFGRTVPYRGTQGTSIVRVFDTVAASTGVNERTLRSESIPFERVYIHPANHAGYYPGAEAMSIKLLFRVPTGEVLGAQIVGGEGVDKRIDVFAMAIQGGMTVFDLEEAELAYSPQFGSAKDPINMAGFVASGVLREDHPVVHVDTLPEQRDALVVDVRTSDEHKLGAIPGAVNIPVDELRERLWELTNRIKAGQLIITYCQVGQRGYLATRILMQRGFNVKNLSGGYRAYQLFHPD